MKMFKRTSDLFVRGAVELKVGGLSSGARLELSFFLSSTSAKSGFMAPAASTCAISYYSFGLHALEHRALVSIGLVLFANLPGSVSPALAAV